MDKEFIKIKTNKNGEQLVSARELYDFLEVGRDFTTWIKAKINKYDFLENVDFSVIWNDIQTGDVVEYNGNSNSMVRLGCRCDYMITIDMAKELSMVENNERGKEMRKYLIKCRKQSPEDYLSALKALVASEEEKLNKKKTNIK